MNRFHLIPAIQFFVTGLESKFKITQLILLWKLAKTADIDDPTSLFWSVSALNRCIAQVITSAKVRNIENRPDIQEFLSKLYSFRTKVELEPPNRHQGLKSTVSLRIGQKLRIILPGRGVYFAQVLNNSRYIIISYPVAENKKIGIIDWKNERISVYFWRKNDASYVFDCTVVESGHFRTESALYLTHSDKLVRSQKRRSIRCPCNIHGQLYVLSGDFVDEFTAEVQSGLKCIIEDLSEDGALIRIGGMGVPHMKVKLQFIIMGILIVMPGTVRGVEFNKEMNQSRLHIESLPLNSKIRNTILSYVYNVLPSEQKEILDAIRLTEEDSGESTEDKI